MSRPVHPELLPELRAELQRSRRAGHDYDVLAKLPQLRAALDAAQASAGDSSAGHAPGSGAAHVTPAAWKLVLLVVAVGVAVVGAWSMRTRQPAPAHPVLGEQHAAPTVHEAQPEPIPPGAEPHAKPPPANEVTASQPESSPPPAARSSRREIAQLVRIRALLAQDPAAAYRLALHSEREFPHGVLSEERQALQVLALAKSGNTDAAEREAQAFFARYPQSPMREQLEAALHR